MTNKIYPAIKVNQWQEHWDSVEWDSNKLRRMPNRFFYTLSMSAKDLIKLSDVYERNTENSETRSGDIGIQRMHNKYRSKKIREFVKYGYPFSDFNETQRNQRQGMKKPGWLPTGIVVNIIQTPKKQNETSLSVHSDDLIRISEQENSSLLAQFELPSKYTDNPDTWKASYLNPIEIIDGQHRLFAFKTEDGKGYIPEAEDFYFPVIAFIDLDISWQAYLFWSINVSPEKINASLAYDMYPLLRTEDWLEENPAIHKIYREARAQEIVETLWSYSESPWYRKINMLGEKGNPYIKQTTWVRAIRDIFFKSGGLFQSFSDGKILAWTRPQQAAFVIFFGQCLYSALDNLIKNNQNSWPHLINSEPDLLSETLLEQAWSGDKSLLNMDSGIHALCMVINRYFCNPLMFEILNEWQQEEEFEDNISNINHVIKNLDNLNKKFENKTLTEHIINLANQIINFDWRSANSSNLTEEEIIIRKTYRGSGGYTSLRDEILKFLSIGA
ncbi:DGQHR domain-containing protein [Acinetobacter vivianii]|uniref:DGQHR domain-containing protein n=1 Tax=Acinetobacter vivianii TaxID=1776742 RepID=UPI001903CC9B|nr:DGQHR domain-containing protein [Acinetobacter vivianii]MBJ8482586.1 DGQHR domain-containing protein [Acinetobacter vivianii]